MIPVIQVPPEVLIFPPGAQHVIRNYWQGGNIPNQLSILSLSVCLCLPNYRDDGWREGERDRWMHAWMHGQTEDAWTERVGGQEDECW